MLEALLNEVAESDDAMWKLCHRHDDHHTPFFNCRAIECFQDDGYNLYRLRPLTPSLSQFRVIYAYDPRRDDFHLLAAVLKLPAVVLPDTPQWTFYGYEPEHPTSHRIRAEYDGDGNRFARIG